MAVLALNLMHDYTPAHGRTVRRAWAPVGDAGLTDADRRGADENDVQGHLIAPRHHPPDRRRDVPLRYP